MGHDGAVFSKTYPSFLTVKEGSTSHLGLLSSGEKKETALLGARNRYAIRLAGLSKVSPYCAVWDRRETDYLYNKLTLKTLVSTYNILKYQNAILLNFRLVSIFLTYSLET